MQRTPLSLHRPASKSSKRRKSRKRRKSKGNGSNQEKYAQLNARTMQSTANHRGQNMEIWRKTYENLAKWHIQHQTQFWQNRTAHLTQENSELKRQLKASTSVKSTTEEYTESSDTDDSNEDESDPAIDEKYLEFLEITRRHQVEVQKTKLNSSSEDCG